MTHVNVSDAEYAAGMAKAAKAARRNTYIVVEIDRATNVVVHSWPARPFGKAHALASERRGEVGKGHLVEVRPVRESLLARALGRVA